MSKKSKIILVAIVVAAIAWYFFGSKGSDQQTNKKPPALVRVTEVSRKDIPMEFETVGTVVPTESVAVRSRLDSQLMEVKFRDGDYVKKDDLLFVLDNNALSAQLRGQEANLARDKAQLDNLERQYKRNEELVKSDFASAAELDDSRAAYEAQKATVNATAAAVQNLRVQLEYTKIKAPIGGRTGTINVTTGNNVKANDTTPLVTINQVKPIRVQFSLPQTYLTAVRQAIASGEVSIFVKQENIKDLIQGKLEYIDNAVDQQTNTFAARALFENTNEALWPGMFVNASVKLGEEKQVLVIPEQAVQHGQDTDFVFTVANDIAKKTSVKVARMQNGNAVIQSGLNDGEKVVTDGIMSLNDGAAVKITTPVDKEIKSENPDQAQ